MAGGKWRKIVLMTAVLGMAFTAGAYASTGLKKVEAYLRPDYQIKVEGKSANLSKQPLIYENSTYLPLTEMAKLLGADVVWDGAAKTIYVNPRRYTTQPQPDDQELEEIEIMYLTGYQAKYLGRTYEILANNTYGNKQYYREKDLQSMGINTNGLQKAKDKITGDIYISSAEASQAWVEQPVLTYWPQPVVSGEHDPDKIEVLRNYKLQSMFIPGDLTDDDTDNDYRLYNEYDLQAALLYAIDAIADKPNEYEGLMYFRNQYYRIYLTLKQQEKSEVFNGKEQTELEWYVSSSRSEPLGPDIDENDPYYGW